MTPEHAKREFERLAGTAPNPATLPDQLLGALARAVPFDSYSWAAIDPRSLLPTGEMRTTIPFPPPLLFEERN